MLTKIRNYLIAKWFIDIVKEIEKTDWMTQILKVAFKQKTVKDNWQGFLIGIDRLLNDAKDELRQAKDWRI